MPSGELVQYPVDPPPTAKNSFNSGDQTMLFHGAAEMYFGGIYDTQFIALEETMLLLFIPLFETAHSFSIVGAQHTDVQLFPDAGA